MFAFSTDGETYRGQFDTAEEAIEKASQQYDDGVFWVGRCRAPIQPELCWDASDWLEYVSVQDDYGGDWAEDWDFSTEEQRTELETAVRGLMADWLDRHNLRPTHCCIEDDVQYRIVGGVVSPIAPIELTEVATTPAEPGDDEPMEKGFLLEWLREDFEDNIDTGGQTWWLKELAERLEVPVISLLDRDQDTGLLFELEQDGDLSYSWLERDKGEFDYLIGLNGGRIEWD